ncbi:thioredoxin family protein [Thermomonospora umbrina]|uniref:Thioredoxin n=1 Tax=Thermomonospora umbrina TaxID=111806 RepID=A0A3D9T2B7_9ACTN|nr:thioredoxin domain-containing protein [Thermomonospora umbrina]REF00504.1 thioredoxin [Thermomonospora umbrina]
MSPVITLTEADFDTHLADTSLPILIDFWAEGCGPCKALEPVLQDLAGRAQGRLRVGSVRLDDNPALAARFEIMTLPTLIVFINGEPAERLTAIRGADDLAERLNRHLTH